MGWEVKIALSCQSKHGLVGSSAKTRNFLWRGHRSENGGLKFIMLSSINHFECMYAKIVKYENDR